jgi:hypothetical protein
MKFKSAIPNPDTISRIAIIVIFLALIRCIVEPLRLEFNARAPLSFDQVKPFIVGSLWAAVGVLVMFLFYLFPLHKMIIVTCVLEIIILLIIKWVFIA